MSLIKLREYPVVIEHAHYDTRPEPTQDVLKCPICNGENLHQETVTVFERIGDSHPDAQRVVVRHPGIAETSTVKSSESGNPSENRQGVRIRFWCETCGLPEDRAARDLCISQHKGTTFIWWEFMR